MITSLSLNLISQLLVVSVKIAEQLNDFESQYLKTIQKILEYSHALGYKD